MPGLEEVDVQALGEADEEEEGIPDLVLDALLEDGVLEAFLDVVLVEEAEEFEEFAGFGGEADGQILGVVELLPVSFVHESLDVFRVRVEAAGHDVGEGRLVLYALRRAWSFRGGSNGSGVVFGGSGALGGWMWMHEG